MARVRVWTFGNDVDTDQIIASQYIILPNIDEMKTHVFETLDPAFASAVQPGDIVIAGENFGCGSSREQAPSALKALGVRAIVAKSFARIFYRNAINIGLPVVLCSEVQEAVKQGDEVELDLAGGTIVAGGKTFASTQLPQHMQNILNSGGLIAYLNSGEGKV